MKTLRQSHLKVPIITYFICVIHVNGVILNITASPQYPNVSTTASLTCHIPSFIGGAEWIKSASSLTQCLPGSCFPSSSGDSRYLYSANAAAITVTISSLDIALDETTWSCVHDMATDIGDFNLTVYNPPGTLSINGPDVSTVYDDVTVYLSVSTGCIHPSGSAYYSVIWKYVEAVSAAENVFGTIIAKNFTSGGSCPNTYEANLKFNLYLTNKMNTGNSSLYISQIKMTFTMAGINVPATLNVAYNVTPNGTASPSSSGSIDPCPDELRIAVGIGLAIIIIGFIIWIVLFLVKGDQFCLGLGICSVITIIGCIISIVFLALKGYQLSLGLGICFGIIILACIICIIILIFVKNGDYLRLGHCICFVIIIIVCISCIVILAKMGGECSQSFLVGLGIGFGILIIVCIISILILVFYKKVTIQNKDTSPSLRTDEKEVTITAIICGLWISVEWIKEKTILENNGDFTVEPYDNNTRKSSLIIKRPSMIDIATYICRAKNRCGCCSAKDSITFPHDKNKPKTGSSADVSRQDVELQVVETGVKSNNKERPPAVRTGTQNKVDSETPSKQTNDRHKPLQPVDTGVEDTPKIRPQPPPPQNSDTKNQNQRGISANFDDTRGLANETARPNKLPPLKDASEEPKKKRKKKKKGQMNDGNPDEEMVQLKSTRTLPGDHSDGD